MKLAKFFLSALMAVGIALPASASVFTIDFETDLSQTPIDLDNGPTIDMISTAMPLTANVAEDTSGQLTISVIAASSFDPANSNVNSSGAGLGVNSPTPVVGSENASRFDVDAAESLTFVFNEDVTLISIDLTSFSGEEEFTAAGVDFANDEATNLAGLPTSDSSDVFTFAGGGISLPAGTSFSLEAGGPAGSSVGLEALTIDFTPAVPEPSSIALLGLFGLSAVARRRK